MVYDCGTQTFRQTARKDSKVWSQQMNAADVAYSAGIFDGEGWAIIAPYNFNSTSNGRIYPRHRMRVGVSNTSRSMLEWFKRTWGGNIYLVYPQRGKRRTLYCWQPSEKLATQFLSRILPYLNIKTRQARLALRFRNTIDRSKRGRPLPKSIIDERNRLMNSMRAANDPLGRLHDRKQLDRMMVKVAK
jgi:hypothetical protein